jgi:hypothetical protein
MHAISMPAPAPGCVGVSLSMSSIMRLILVGSCPTMAGAMRSRIAAASSGPVCGDFATLDGSMLLMPVEPSDALTRTATHFVVLFETPALVKVPTSGMATPNTSTRSIFRLTPFPIQSGKRILTHFRRRGGSGRKNRAPRCR